jgi:uncharacterized protein (DUF1800 family)
VKKTSRREFLVTGAAAVAFSAALFKGAQGWLSGLGQYAGIGIERPLGGPLGAPSAREIDPVSHALNRLTFGHRPGDHARVSAMGVQAFISEQLAPETIDDSHCDRAIARFGDLWNEPLAEFYDEDDNVLAPILRRLTLLRAIYSERQLFEVMCEFWSDHFNIDPGKGECRWSKPHDDLTVIRKHALGNFRDMLAASALSPAMLWYLDGQANTRRTPDDKPNENYARELMELHTLGVHGGYTQQDVMEVARCLTGWTVRSKKQARITANILNPFNTGGTDARKPVQLPGDVHFVKEAHDDGPKRVLGQHIPAGLGKGDLDRVIEIVCGHPSTARFIAHKLCVRFIADAPPATAVDAVASAFTATKGDTKATLRSLFATPEFAGSTGAKFKRPLHFIVSALRATNAATSADQRLFSYLERMGHMPFRWPTPDGYPATAKHWHATLLWRWNFALALANNRIGGTSIRREALQAHIGSDYGLMASLLGRQPCAEESDACLKSGDGLALLLASPAFQRC